jgi:predicted membrane channel-forming protein YqfA (hemolysin III family)
MIKKETEVEEIVENAPYPPTTPSNYRFLAVLLIILFIIIVLVTFSIFQETDKIQTPLIIIAGITLLVGIIFLYLGIRKSHQE